MHAAQPARAELEPGTQRLNLWEREWQHQQAQAIQEKHRLRVEIPRSAQAEAPVPSPSQTPAQSEPPVDTSEPGFWLDLLLCGGVVVGLGLVAVPLAERLSARLKPWEAPHVAATEAEFAARNEEHAFNEFMATFMSGPRPAPRVTEAQAPPPVALIVATPEPEPDAPGLDPPARRTQYLHAAKKLIEALRIATDEPLRHKHAAALAIKIGLLKGMAENPELLPLWQVCSAVEGLLGQLVAQPSKITPSTIRTVSIAVELLEELCRSGANPKLSSEPPLRFLAVDDDMICRHAVGLALKKAFNQPDTAASGKAALALATEQTYDAIFLDIQMPEVNGFELCTKIRQTTPNQATPVVFVTYHDNPETRADSKLFAGSELMAKPFLTFEITVRALSLALKGRLEGKRREAPTTVTEPEPGATGVAAPAAAGA
jgi:CheY-like chemotaxis protein